MIAGAETTESEAARGPPFLNPKLFPPRNHPPGRGCRHCILRGQWPISNRRLSQSRLTWTWLSPQRDGLRPDHDGHGPGEYGHVERGGGNVPTSTDSPGSDWEEPAWR